MTPWRPIETADGSSDADPVLLARFRPGNKLPDYVVSAQYGVAMPGWFQLATYCGWFVDGVPLDDPTQYRGTRMFTGILPEGNLGPTHWMPLPEPPPP